MKAPKMIVGKVSFLPGGVEIVEGTMAALYDGLGVPDPVTVGGPDLSFAAIPPSNSSSL